MSDQAFLDRCWEEDHRAIARKGASWCQHYKMKLLELAHEMRVGAAKEDTGDIAFDEVADAIDTLIHDELEPRRKAYLAASEGDRSLL